VNEGENEVAQPSCNHDTNFPSGRLADDYLSSGLLATSQAEPPVEHTTVDGKERSNEVVCSLTNSRCGMFVTTKVLHALSIELFVNTV
jgi:hypothetical protein